MPKRICLIVDDEPVIRSFLREILEQQLFHIVEAESATHALKVIQKLNGRLDLIVTDIRMPGDMDGLDLAHSVRNAYPMIPVILISGYSDKAETNRGEFEFIAKPFGMDTILKALERVLGSQR